MHPLRSPAELARHVLRRKTGGGLAGPVTETVTQTVKTVVVTPTVTAQPPNTTTSSRSTVTSIAIPPTTTQSSSTSLSSSSTSVAVASSVTPSSLISSEPHSTTSAFATPITTTSSGLGAEQSSSNDSSQNSSTVKSKGISGAAIGAIVAVIVIIVLGALVFIIRKRLINRRKQRRNTWGAGMFPSQGEKANNFSSEDRSGENGSPPIPEKPRSPLSPSGFGTGSQLPYDTAPLIAPPPMSYNNAIESNAYDGISHAGNPPPSLTPSQGLTNVKETALVRCVFIPSLPDELSISTGEFVHVLNPYDDGWALCANRRGEQGMVPLECLDRGKQAPQSAISGQEDSDWRSMRRISSLQSGNRVGGY